MILDQRYFSSQTNTLFQDDGNLAKNIGLELCCRYLDLDDIIEESSIETDDGAEEEEEDSDG